MEERLKLSVQDVYRVVAPSESSLDADQVDDSHLSCKLWEYQRRTVGWAIDREKGEQWGVRGGVIAEEMGLGKTVEVMALVCSHQPPDIPPRNQGGAHPHATGLLYPCTGGEFNGLNSPASDACL